MISFIKFLILIISYMEPEYFFEEKTWHIEFLTITARAWNILWAYYEPKTDYWFSKDKATHSRSLVFAAKSDAVRIVKPAEVICQKIRKLSPRVVQMHHCPSLNITVRSLRLEGRKYHLTRKAIRVPRQYCGTFLLLCTVCALRNRNDISQKKSKHKWKQPTFLLCTCILVHKKYCEIVYVFLGKGFCCSFDMFVLSTQRCNVRFDSPSGFMSVILGSLWWWSDLCCFIKSF